MKKLLMFLFFSLTMTFTSINGSTFNYIYVGDNDGYLYKISDTGNLLWTSSQQSGGIWSAQMDSAGNAITGNVDGQLIKTLSNNSIDWSVTLSPDRIWKFEMDFDDNAYAVSGDSFYKVDPSGNIEYSVNVGTTLFSITVDNSGNVYVGSSDTIYKYDNSGNFLSSQVINNTSLIWDLDINPSGNLVVSPRTENIIILDNNLNLLNTFTLPSNLGDLYYVSVDNDGNMYTSGYNGNTFYVYDSSFNEIWNSGSVNKNDSYIHSYDNQGNSYYLLMDFEKVSKYDSLGNELWTYTALGDLPKALATTFEPTSPEPPEYDVELQSDTSYNDFIYQDDEVNVTTDSVITTILNDESFTVTSTAVNTGSYTFNYWYDLDNMEVFTTDRNFTIEDPNRDYNLIADYTLDSFNTFNIDSNLPSPQDFTFNTFTLENQVYSFNQSEFNNYQHPDDRQWEIIAPTTNIGFYEFDYYYDNDNNDIYDFNNVITGSGFSPPNLTAVYSLPEEYQINLIIESGIGDIIFQHGENDPISGPFISQTIGLGDDWSATAPSNEDYQFDFWFDLNTFNSFSNNQTININNTEQDYYLEALYVDLVDINWDSAGGTQIPQQTVVINSSIQPPPEPTRPGFIFDYWEDSNQNEVIFPKTITEDVTFTAVWIETYTLTYDTNRGGQINPDTYLENEVPQVVTPSRFGYEFDGWYTDDGTFQNEYDFTDPITVDTTIHAKWQFGSDRDASLSLTTFLDDNDLGDGFSQIIIMTALYIFINVMIYVYSGPLVVTLILNFILSSIFLILGWIPMWIIIVIFIGLFGFIYLSSSGRGAME